MDLYTCMFVFYRVDLAYNVSMDLNELAEQPACKTMVSPEPTTEVSNENMYANCSSVD